MSTLLRCGHLGKSEEVLQCRRWPTCPPSATPAAGTATRMLSLAVLCQSDRTSLQNSSEVWARGRDPARWNRGLVVCHLVATPSCCWPGVGDLGGQSGEPGRRARHTAPHYPLGRLHQPLGDWEEQLKCRLDVDCLEDEVHCLSISMMLMMRQIGHSLLQLMLYYTTIITVAVKVVVVRMLVQFYTRLLSSNEFAGIIVMERMYVHKAQNLQNTH